MDWRVGTIVGMVQRKQRALLIDVQSLDASAAPPSAPLHTEMRDAVRRSTNAVESETAALNAIFYSREARLCMVRTSLKGSADVRAAIKSVRYVQQWPVKLVVTRTFGNERLARRDFARRLDAVLPSVEDKQAQKRIRELVNVVNDLQRA